MALILQGGGFGFSAGVIPGPLLSYLISTTLFYGWRRGILVIFAPLISDLPIIVVMTFLLSGLSSDAERVLRVIGGAYVLWLAWLSLGDYRAGAALGVRADAAPNDPPGTPRETLLRAVAMNYLSPGPYIFWSVVTGPILRDALERSTGEAAVFVASFYLTFLGLMAVWVLLFDRLRRVDPRFTRGLLLAAIVVLGGFGLQMIAQGLIG